MLFGWRLWNILKYLCCQTKDFNLQNHCLVYICALFKFSFVTRVEMHVNDPEQKTIRNWRLHSSYCVFCYLTKNTGRISYLYPLWLERCTWWNLFSFRMSPLKCTTTRHIHLYFTKCLNFQSLSSNNKSFWTLTKEDPIILRSPAKFLQNLS